MGKALNPCKSFSRRSCGQPGVSTLEVGEEFGPVFPKLLPHLVGRSHDPIGSGFCRSSEQTSKLTLACGNQTFQEAFCDKGKSVLNLLAKSVSDRQKFPAPPVFEKDRLARSAILLCAPAIDQGAMGDACVMRCRKLSARTSRCPTMDRREQKRVAHETVDMLSTHAATCLCLRFAMSSSTI